MSQTIKQITSHLWVAQSELYELNSGLIISDNQICIIDPGLLPAEIDALADYVNERDFPAQVLILTHSHWDHILGTDRFPESRLFAQENYLSEVEKEGGDRINQQVQRWFAEQGIKSEQPFVIPIPHETFSDMMTLPIGGLSLQLIHAPGHRADQLVIYNEEEQMLWAGDMLSDSEIPYVIHNLDAYRASLERLSTLNIKVLVPGHGTPTLDKNEIQTRLADDRTYLAALREQVSQAISQGLTVSETVAKSTNFLHPQIASNAHAHQLNLESAYLELGGPADPKLVGWHRNTD